MVHKLMDRGVLVNEEETMGMGVCLAVSEGRFKVALALLDRGAPIEEINLHMVFPSIYQDEYNVEEMDRGDDRRQDRAELLLRVVTAIGHLESMEVWDSEYESTCLFQVAAYAFDANCVQLLLDAGARVDSAVQYFNPDLYNQPAVPQTMMWGILNIADRHRPDLSTMSTGRLMELKDSIRLLLQHGASLDSLNGNESALEFACSHPKILRSGLLECLVKNASASNVSLQHIERVMKRCGDDVKVDTAVLLKQMHETVSEGTMKVKTENRGEEGDNEVERSE
ncbi:hypothetical protein QQX98_000280 [Neonectria punicea]|uniref:Uncharacterized protein n=1 Tax=Neonectria punicea TaxID=979145 RepID=A0ABR1HUR8_9HYPO